MKNIFILLLIIFLCFSELCSGQIHFKEKIKENTIVSNTPKSVFFVDFWASWCGPCIHLWKQLEVFQEYFPDELYILSLTQENKSIVSPFIQKHPSKLAVAIDKQGDFHKKIGVSQFPHGVIYNSTGELLWQGNPSDLSFEQLQAFIDKSNAKISVSEFFSYDQDLICFEFLKNIENQTDLLKDGYKLVKHNSLYEGKDALIQKYGDYIAVTGKFSQILAFLLKCSNNQIKLNNIDESHYSILMSFADAQKVEKDIFKMVLSEYNLQYEEIQETKDVLEFSFKNENTSFWDRDQIVWNESETQVFLFENGQLLADNCSIEMLAYKISSIKNIPILIKTPLTYYPENYDWNVHFKYDNLMESSFTSFGINIKKVQTQIPFYCIEMQ